MGESGRRVLVVGAGGAVGGVAARQLAGHGARVALAGRNRGRLEERAEALGGRPWRVFDAYDLDRCAGLAGWARGELGGLDAVVVAVGVAGFGPVTEVPIPACEHLFAVNALAPIAVVRGALEVLDAGGAAVVVTGEIVDHPALGMADYAAAKTALATWLGVAGREARRRDITVTDARLPHLDTGFAQRPVVGRAPAFGPGGDPEEAVARLVVAPALAVHAERRHPDSVRATRQPARSARFVGW
ncbi:SDR family NAD(P)-dependent oxidoreductase [Streptomyces goshikiensis]|uniref:SDR family NAD(P)-dependent oxidoreductase n=1 Tax=Streptomyces TaxID=1883 RepID=UPI000C27B60B|nr:SDR family oxidoreductase [Streptomyces sp. CB02120-2]PJN19528.1 SDR family oxidoreductase [Streptomyces sp. CB02120-2]